MKFFRLLACLPMILLGGKAHCQTLNWGNEVFGVITDSNGIEVDNTFFFELGGFFNGFVPDGNNISQWLENWQVFDYATYDDSQGTMNGEVIIQENVTSDNPSASTASFAGLDAYIWVRKGDQPIAGSEWLLVRSTDWVFPASGGGDCCDQTLMEFSTDSDLSGLEIPLYGRHHTTEGPGVFTDAGTGSSLQTYTFIPEPSSVMLILFSALGLMCRRNRSSC